MPRPDKFYLIELVEDPRGYRDEDDHDRQQQLRPERRRTRQVTLTEQLRFTLQFGKRIAVTPTPRSAAASASRSRPAASAATSTSSDDQLLLSVDVFDAKANQYPRIKATLSYAIWERNLFLVAGADDMVKLRARAPARRRLFDYFAGLQLTFNDEDLRSLLLFGGGAAAGAASK